MTFCVFYNASDLQQMATQFASVSTSGLVTADKNLGTAIWNGGLNGWQTAPIYTGPQALNDPDCRAVVVSATYQGKTVMIADPTRPGTDLIGLLRRMSVLQGGAFMWAIAQDLQVGLNQPTGSCKDPYP